MRFPILSFLVTLVLTASAAAQPGGTRTVKGTVIDAGSGAPIIGATIRVYRTVAADSMVLTRYGSITSSIGRFELRLPADSSFVLEAGSLGYTSRQQPLGPADDSVGFALTEREALRQQVQVTAARRSRSVEDACCRVESIREEVQQHAPFSPSAIDVLRRYSSCTSTRVACALDNSQSIRLRGLEPTYIAVLVDGMPAISGLGTAYGLGIIPAHALQTIRIAEGASSGLYGNGAVSGIVDLQLRQPTEISELMITGNVSDHELALPGERDLNVSYTGLIGDVGIAAFGSANAHEREGVISGRYDRLSGLLKGNILLGGATEVTATALVGRELREGATHPAINGSVEGSERVEHLRGDLSLKLGHTFADKSELLAGGLVSRTTLDARYFDQPLDASQRILYGNLTYLREIGDHALTIGGELRGDRLLVANGPAIGYENSVASLFIQDELPLSDLFTIMGSARLDRHSDAGTIISPRGSLKFEPGANTTMRLMAGSGFKGQALFDEQQHRALHGEMRWVANEGIDFERSFTLNYDISHSLLIGSEVGVDLNFNAYHTVIEGKVVLDGDSLAAGSLFMVNSDQPARLAGLELQIRPTLGEHWSGSLALALIDYRMRTDAGVYERIPLAPSFNLDASAMYRDVETGISAEIWGSHVGAQRLAANPFGLASSTPYTLLNARFEKSFGTIALYLGVNNILDQTQTETMPLLFAGETGVEAGTVWGPIEGRETFLGFRLTLPGSEQQ